MAPVPPPRSYPTISVMPQGPLAGSGSGLPRPPGVIGAGAQFTGYPRAPWTPGGSSLALGVPTPGPNIVPTTGPETTGSITGGADGTGLLTLDALMQRQKELQGKQPEMPTMQSPWQGAAYALDKALQGFQEGGNQRDILAQEASRADILGTLDPKTGIATPDQIAAMSRVDPELAEKLYAAAMVERGRADKQEHWSPVPTPEGENGQWFRNDVSGETKKVGGGAPGEGGWKPGDMGSLRDDYTKAASVYDNASPSWQSMKDAAKAAIGKTGVGVGAADYNLVVGLAKILDPNSVVRQGETESVVATGGAADYLVSYFNKLTGGGTLSDDIRRGIMTTGQSRMKAYYDQARGKRDWISGIATRNKVNPDDVVPPLAEFQGWTEDTSNDPPPAERDN
jgi:hypothetical protein